MKVAQKVHQKKVRKTVLPRKTIKKLPNIVAEIVVIDTTKVPMNITVVQNIISIGSPNTERNTVNRNTGVKNIRTNIHSFNYSF
jgi:hypothetical protein